MAMRSLVLALLAAMAPPCRGAGGAVDEQKKRAFYEKIGALEKAGQAAEAASELAAAIAGTGDAAEVDELIYQAISLGSRHKRLPIPEKAKLLAANAENMPLTDKAAAAAEMEKAMLAAPWWPQAHYNLGVMRAAAEDYAGAKRSYSFYLFTSPKAKVAAEVRTAMGYMDMKGKEQKEAEERGEFNLGLLVDTRGSVLLVGEDGPAARAGILKGDRIVKLDGTSWAKEKGVSEADPADPLGLDYKRGTAVRVTFSRPGAPAREALVTSERFLFNEDDLGSVRAELRRKILLAKVRALESRGKAAEAARQLAAAIAEAGDAAEVDRLLEESARLAGRMGDLPVPEEAERLAVRAETLAKTDPASGAAEMEKAVAAAPWWPEAHFNLGMMRKEANDHAGAKRSLELYLLASPKAKDAKEVKTLIYEIEAVQDQAAKVASRSGYWVRRFPDGSVQSFRLTFKGTRFEGKGSYDFMGTLDGDRIEGNVTIGAGSFYLPGGEGVCDTPAETVPFKGELAPSGVELTLRWIQTEWAAAGWIPGKTIMGIAKCTGAVPKSQLQQELILEKPPEGSAP